MGHPMMANADGAVVQAASDGWCQDGEAVILVALPFALQRQAPCICRPFSAAASWHSREVHNIDRSSHLLGVTTVPIHSPPGKNELHDLNS